MTPSGRPQRLSRSRISDRLVACRRPTEALAFLRTLAWESLTADEWKDEMARLPWVTPALMQWALTAFPAMQGPLVGFLRNPHGTADAVESILPVVMDEAVRMAQLDGLFLTHQIVRVAARGVLAWSGPSARQMRRILTDVFGTVRSATPPRRTIPMPFGVACPGLLATALGFCQPPTSAARFQTAVWCLRGTDPSADGSVRLTLPRVAALLAPVPAPHWRATMQRLWAAADPSPTLRWFSIAVVPADRQALLTAEDIAPCLESAHPRVRVAVIARLAETTAAPPVAPPPRPPAAPTAASAPPRRSRRR